MFRLLSLFTIALGLLSAQALPSVSVSPVVGAGSEATIVVTVSETGELQRLSTIRVLIRQQLTGVGACFLQHAAGSASLRLRNDNNTVWQEPVLFGGAADTGNNQCQVIAADSSASEEGAIYTLTLKIRFDPRFAGRKLIWVQAVDDAGMASGAWHYRADWVVPGTVSGVATDCIRVDGSAGPCLATFRVDRFRVAEPVPTSFTLSYLPMVGADPKVYRNGLLLMPGDDYNLTGRDLTFQTPVIPADNVQIEYWVQ